MMDFVLEAWVSLLIERTKVRWMLGRGKPWQRLRVLNEFMFESTND